MGEMRWRAQAQAVAQRRGVEQDPPRFAMPPGGKVEGRAIARDHPASFLAIDQRRTCAIAGDQIVQIGAHQGAAAAALGANLDLQPLHHAHAQCPAWPEGNDPGGVCHDRGDSEALSRASSSTSEKSAMPFHFPYHRYTDGSFLAWRPRRGTCQRKPDAGLLHIRCDPAGARARYAPAVRSPVERPRSAGSDTDQEVERHGRPPE